MQAGDQFFIIIHAGHTLHFAGQGFPHGQGRAYTDVLYRDRVDSHCTRRFVSGLIPTGIDRDIIHAHIILGRDGGGDLRIHRVTVKQRFALTVRLGTLPILSWRLLLGCQPVAPASAQRQSDDGNAYGLFIHA